MAGTRTIPFPQVVIDALKPRIAGCAADGPAVTSPTGKMLRSNNWRRHTHWNKVLKKTRLAPLTIHELRHTYASLASPAQTCATCRKPWGIRRPSSPRTSTATSTPTSRTRWQPTSISFMRLRFTHRRPDKNRTNQNDNRGQLMQVRRGGQGRDRTGDLPLFRRTLVPTELPGRKAQECLAESATLTGLEPATSAVTGRRANQLRHRALQPLRVSASWVPPTGFEPALPP